MRTLNSLLLHIYIWLCRIRHRRGYGVHSPWAFQFITGVVNESGRYYAYDTLALQCDKNDRRGTSVKVERLLFRLANFVQPKNIVVVGDRLNQSADYLQAGCRSANVLRMDSTAWETASAESVDLLYVGHGVDILSAFQHYAKGASSNSLFVLSDIHSSKTNAHRWREVCGDSRVVLTFDLFDVGLVFFDASRNEQHYIVSF